MFPHLGESEPSEKRRGRVRTLPNYSSRRVQVRLLMLVFGVMFVLLAMQSAGDPDFWWFMGFKDDKLAEDEKQSGDFDSRLRFDGNGNPIVPDAGSKPTTDDVNSGLPAIDRIKQDSWRKMLDKLTQEERTLLAKALKSVRDHTQLPDQDLHAWTALVGKLDEHWQAFLRTGWDAVSRLTDDPVDKKAAWLRALSQVENEWNRHIKGSLQAAANLDKVSEEVRKDLAGLQSLLDELALAQVPDNTMFLKPRHRETRYRLLDMLRQTSHE